MIRGLFSFSLFFFFVPALALAGTQMYTTPGTYTFTVPVYSSLVVQVWGAGGGGGDGYSEAGGGAGGYSSFGTIVGYGGASGNGSSIGGAGGGATGGSANTQGGNGGNGGGGLWGTDGGNGGTSPSGGAGGEGYRPGSDQYPGHAAYAGAVPGGGGGGGYSGGAGGGGGFSTHTYPAGQLSVGGSVTVVVGSAGAGSGGWFPGAPGARGQVNIAWNDPANCTFNGQTVYHGSGVTAYAAPSVPYGSSCISQWRVCNNGTLSGSYAYPSCSVNPPANCSLPWGGTLAHGSSVTAYAAPSVPYGSSCISQSRSCNNGSLSGSYQYQSCSVAAPPPPTCNVWADTNPIAYGATTRLRWTSSNATSFYINSVGYVTPNQTSNTSVGPLSSTNYGGSASGAGGSISCPFTLTVNPPANCTFNGQTVYHGSSVTAFQSPSVPWNQTCNSQQRTCNNGSLSGNYNHATCTVSNPPPTCALSVNPTSVTQGQPSTLTWSSSNATSCTGNNFSTGGATAGNVSVSPIQSTTYTASCTRPGSSTAQCTGTGAGGIGALLTVSCTPAYTCTGAGNQTITYRNAQCQTSTVTTCSPPQFCSEGASVCVTPIASGSITVTPRVVNAGGTTRVTWSATNVSSCTVSGSSGIGGEVSIGDIWMGTSGSQTSSPISRKVTYTLACDDYDADTIEDNLIKTATVFTVAEWHEQ